MNAKLFSFVILLITHEFYNLNAYEIPKINLETSTEGFRLSMPDENGVTKVFIMAEVNGMCPGHLDYITKPENGRWSSKMFPILLKNNDNVVVSSMIQNNNDIFKAIEYIRMTGPQTYTVVSNVKANIDLNENCDYDAVNNLDNDSDNNNDKNRCIPSITVSNRIFPGQRVCKNDLIFEENFKDRGLNENNWVQELRIPMDGDFVLFAQQAVVNDDNLIIKPILLHEFDSRINPNILNKTRLDLGINCTGVQNYQEECERNGSIRKILPPIVTARVSTKKSFTFKYGRVEIRAKLPKGDWLFPLLLLEPITRNFGTDAMQIRIAYVRGNLRLQNSNTEIFDGRTLYAGLVLTYKPLLRNTSIISTTRQKHFGDDYHIYTLKWSQNLLTFEVDNQVYGTLDGVFPNEVSRIPNLLEEQYFITLGMSAGGHIDFPDNVGDKPWINSDPLATNQFWKARNSWWKTWEDSELKVDYVRVYAI